MIIRESTIKWLFYEHPESVLPHNDLDILYNNQYLSWFPRSEGAKGRRVIDVLIAKASIESGAAASIKSGASSGPWWAWREALLRNEVKDESSVYMKKRIQFVEFVTAYIFNRFEVYIRDSKLIDIVVNGRTGAKGKSPKSKHRNGLGHYDKSLWSPFWRRFNKMLSKSGPE